MAAAWRKAHPELFTKCKEGALGFVRDAIKTEEEEYRRSVAERGDWQLTLRKLCTVAIRYGHLDIVKYLVVSKRVPVTIRSPTAAGETKIAIGKRKKKKKKKKKKKGDLGTQTGMYNFYDTDHYPKPCALFHVPCQHEAIEAHRLDIVQYLLKEKSCVNETNMYGDHALLCAVKSHAPISILESLLKAKVYNLISIVRVK
eukprot:jgi/Bigna1/76018/fgenesh1_pg.38_\